MNISRRSPAAGRIVRAAGLQADPSLAMRAGPVESSKVVGAIELTVPRFPRSGGGGWRSLR